jgi:hypothetical protein
MTLIKKRMEALRQNNPAFEALVTDDPSDNLMLL